MAKLSERISALKNEENAETIDDVMKSADELDKSNKQLYSRAKKAEGFENKDGQWVKIEKPKEPLKESKSEPKQPETDYGKLAYLNSKGIDNPDDQKIVTDEAKRLNLPIEKVLNEKHIQNQLKDVKNQREAEGGMPKDGGSSSGGNKGSVEYWQNKKDKDGNYITPDDTELANKVIDARLKSEEKGSMFSDDLHN